MQRVCSKHGRCGVKKRCMVLISAHRVLRRVPQVDHQRRSYLAAVLLGTVRAADGCGGDGAGQLGVGAQHGVGLSGCSRT